MPRQAILFADPEGRLLTWNPDARRLLPPLRPGVSARALLGEAMETGELRLPGRDAPLRVTSHRLEDGGVAFVLAEPDAADTWRDVFDQMGDGITILDAGGRYLDMNRAALEALGYERDDVPALRLEDVVADDLRKNPIRREALEAGETVVNERRLRRKDGRILEAEVTTRRLPDGRLVSISRDISQRRQREEALRQSEANYRLLVDASPDPMIVHANGRIVYVNDAAVRLVAAASRDEMIGRDALHYLHPSFREMVGRRNHDIRRTGEPAPLLEQKYVRTDGTAVDVEVTAIPVVFRGEEGVQVLLRDVSARKAAERALLESEWRYRTLVETAPELIYTLDLEGRIMTANPAAERILGWPLKELTRLTFRDVLHPDDLEKAEQVFAHSLASRQVAVNPLRLRRRDGSWVEVEVSSRPLEQEGRTIGVFGIARDVTERNRLEQELEQSNRLASVGRLAAAVAHEFNNVLMGIQPFADLVQRTAAGDANLQKAALHVGRSVQRGRHLSQEILRFASASDPVPEPTDLGELLRHSLPELQAIAGDQVRITLDVAAGLPMAAVDRGKIVQALINVVANARDAMKGQGTISIALAQRGELISLSVADQGEGIVPDDLPHIFEPMFSTRRGSTGLGLSIVHQIVKKHRGEIQVESVRGRGTTFRILVPAGDPDTTAAPRPEPATAAISSIVLVEDDASVAEGLKMLLEAEGIEVNRVGLGREAEAAVAATDPDVVVLDLGLPDVDGAEVLARLRARWPALPVLVSTGHGDERIADGDRIGHLYKPYSIEELLAALRELTRPGPGESPSAPPSNGSSTESR